MIAGDTIVAVATPFGYSGIAVIRLSGPGSINLIIKTTSRSFYENRVATLACVRSPGGETIDRALVTVFSSPKSYTGEDLVEISTHGNPSIINGVISLLVEMGARLAEPGEFTYRAFMNGKMDLVQAEAVASLIHSKSEENSRVQQKIISGDLSLILNRVRSELILQLSTLEYQMDISEEDITSSFFSRLIEKIDNIKEEVRALLGTYEMGRLLNGGLSVVISGAPNVGKSSLFNLIANADRAIVSDQPGTTRDVIDVEIILSGVPVRFFDTAGLRKASGAIEKEGVVKALDKKRSADIVLSVYDSPKKKPTTPNEKNKTIYVLNKLDIHKDRSDQSVIHISCLEKVGLDLLFLKIQERAGVEKVSTNISYLSTARQFSALSRCSQFLDETKRLLSSRPDELELIAYELREAVGSLDVLLGKTTAEEIINNIFSTLCVGK